MFAVVSVVPGEILSFVSLLSLMVQPMQSPASRYSLELVLRPVLVLTSSTSVSNLHFTVTSCRWETPVMRYITSNVLQTNKVDAHCDQLATELKAGTHYLCSRATSRPVNTGVILDTRPARRK